MSQHIEEADYPNGRQYGDVRTSIGTRVFRSTFNGPVFLDRYTRVGPDVTFGRYCGFGENSSIIRSDVGSFFHCGNNVAINPFSHPTDWLSISDFQWRDDSFGWVDEYRKLKRPFTTRPPEMFSHVSIGNDCWIGHGAMIIGNVTVGDGAIIAAGAIVTKDVPSYAIMMGVPARVAKYRFPQHTIDRLLRAKWWELPLSELSGLPFQNVNACLAELEKRQLQKNAEQARMPDHPMFATLNPPQSDAMAFPSGV